MQQDEKKVLNTLTAYGAGFQIKVLSSLLKHKEFLQTINDVISPEMFDNPSSQWIVSQILKCYYKYHATPSLDYLQIEVKKIDNEVLKVSVVDQIKEAYKASNEDQEYVEQEFSKVKTRIWDTNTTKTLKHVIEKKREQLSLLLGIMLTNCLWEDLERGILALYLVIQAEVNLGCS